MPKIDLTPTREEHARICAYILAAQEGTITPYAFGDYWNYTEAEEEIIFKAWQLWEAYMDFWDSVGVELRDVPKSHRKKAAQVCIAKARS